jgi:hypothetical protein
MKKSVQYSYLITLIESLWRFNLIDSRGVIGRRQPKKYPKKELAAYAIKDLLKNGAMNYNDLYSGVMNLKKVSKGIAQAAIKELMTQEAIIKQEDGSYKLAEVKK